MSHKIIQYTENMTKEQFRENEPVRDLVTKKLENIGEAVKHITSRFPEFSSSHPTIPWSGLAKTRDKLAHGYFNIDPDILWSSAQEDVPNIHAEIHKINNQRRANATAAALRAQNQGMGN